MLTTKKNLHYLSAANDKQFTLNMKEQPEILSAEQYDEICKEMLAFQESNNRLSFADDAGVEQIAKVEDKSFSFIDDEQKAAFAEPKYEAAPVEMYEPPVQQAPAEKSGGIISGIRSLFRAP